MLGNNSHVLTWVNAPWNRGGALSTKVFFVDGIEIPFRFNPPIPFPFDSVNLTSPYIYPPQQVPYAGGVAASDFDKATIIVQMVQSGVQECTGWTPTFNTVWALLWPGTVLPPATPEESGTQP